MGGSGTSLDLEDTISITCIGNDLHTYMDGSGTIGCYHLRCFDLGVSRAQNS